MKQESEQPRKKFEEEGFTLARVAAEHKDRYSVLWDNKIIPAEVTGRLMYSAESRKDYPAVGDWVAVHLYENSHAIIHHVLPRSSFISRKSSGKEFNEQLLAANMDIVFIVQGLDDDYNIRRMERYLVVASESGAVPVVLLSKSDLLADDGIRLKAEEVKRSAPGITVITYSAKNHSHIEEIKKLIAPETTVCFIGSSGVGKSTLINTLAGKELLETNEVREADSKGRHTTTRRELIPLENGGFVIDTPGMRELGLWNDSGAIDEVFPEIAALSRECRFTDCTHIHEPDCAVRAAVDQGQLAGGRYESYVKLKKEAEYVASKTDIFKSQERKAKEKQLGRAIKLMLKTRKKR